MTQHTIQVGDQEVPLPEGVTLAEWSEERTYRQNPRIRAFLGCIQMLAGVMESNYAILHCSPERLLEIWRKVREVAELMLEELAPLLEEASPLPQLDEARETARTALELLRDTEIAELLAMPVDTQAKPAERIAVRKQLCVTIGQLHNFLQDAFGEIMAADPRSLHDADYFLSKRFPQDVEEAEWLHATVTKLRDYLSGDLEVERQTVLQPMMQTLRREQTVPTARAWESTRLLLERLVHELTPRLREVLALRGIRFEEMETLDRYASEIPSDCLIVLEVFDVARAATDKVKELTAATRPAREQGVRDLVTVHAVTTARLLARMEAIDSTLQDLISFVPIWIDFIEKRRALLLRRGAAAGSRHVRSGAVHTDEELENEFRTQRIRTRLSA